MAAAVIVQLPSPTGAVRLDVDPSDHIGRRIHRRRDWYERDLLDDLRSRVTVPGVAVDVGAHIGNHTVWMAAVCGLRVVALEPNPSTRAQLQTNVRLAGVEGQVTVLDVAAGASCGSGTLDQGAPGNTGTARVRSAPTGDVRVVPLDALGLADVKVIKVDVEGGELDVLRGAAQTLRRCKPVLYVEVRDKARLAIVDQWLGGYGYSRFGCYALTPTYGYAVTRPRTVSAAIMAHPARRPFVEELAMRLDRPVEPVWDERNDRWDTGRRSLLAFDESASHHLVIQDDSIPCRDLFAGCERLLSYVPDGRPVALYFGRRWTSATRRVRGRPMAPIIEAAKSRTASFAVFEGPWWGLAVIVPTGSIRDLVRFGDEQTIPNYDHRMAAYFAAEGVDCYYTLPSLVEHRTGPSNPSLLGRGTGDLRQAAWFIGEDRSATDVTWNGRAVTASDVTIPPRPWAVPA